MILSNSSLFLGLSHQTQTSSSQLLSYPLSLPLSEGMSYTMNELVRHIRLPQVLDIKSAPLIKISRIKKNLDIFSNYAPWIPDYEKHFAQINKTHTNIYKHKYWTDQGVLLHECLGVPKQESLRVRLEGLGGLWQACALYCSDKDEHMGQGQCF